KVFNLLKVSGIIAGPEQKIAEAIKIPTVKVTVIRPLSDTMGIAAQPIDPATGQPVQAQAQFATAPAKLRVVLEGTVKTQADYQHLVEVVRGFVEDEQVSNLVVIEDPIQVTFQAYVLQVNRNNVKDLGVDWGGAQSLSEGLTQGTLRFVENISNAFRGDSQANGAPIERTPNPFAMNNINRFDIIAAQVRAWESKNKVKVLSNPKLTVYANAASKKLAKAGWFDEKDSASNDTEITNDSGLAFVNVGQDVFYISSRDTAGNVSWAKAEAALRLTIRDLYVHENELKFTVFAKQDEPSFSRGTEAPPDILKRSVMTTVKIGNGETVVLGGLIQNSKSVTERGLPVLSKLPYVGRLFRNKSTQTQENELVILLTPEIKGRETNFDRTKKYEVVPVPHRSERLEQLHQMFQQIKGSHFPPETAK
ncbi:MAG TPA: type II and III secretion system protein, partial [Candidatus Ozemobacteraceae bacterium]|nr:type II and III secretion system protein [Candidatus Ozemobacteraceae bacterium]